MLITIVYRLGKKAAVPDALSRIPEHAQPEHEPAAAMASHNPHTEGTRVALTLCNEHATPASGRALTQPDADGNQLPMCYMSKTLMQAQRNYPTHDRELYAIVASC